MKKQIAVRLPQSLIDSIDLHRHTMFRLTGIEASRTDAMESILNAGLIAVTTTDTPGGHAHRKARQEWPDADLDVFGDECVSFHDEVPNIGDEIYCDDDDGWEMVPRVFFGTTEVDGETYALVSCGTDEFFPRHSDDPCIGMAYMTSMWAHTRHAL